MSATLIDPVEARRLVEARLGRRPQDMLEAAVALEAWAGLHADGALVAAREVMRDASEEPEASSGALPERSADHGALREALAFLITVIAIACWTAPLAASVGAGVVGRGVMLALPVTLGLQWGLSSRYLAREHGRAQLARRRPVLALAACTLVGASWLALGQAGLIAGLSDGDLGLGDRARAVPHVRRVRGRDHAHHGRAARRAGADGDPPDAPAAAAVLAALAALRPAAEPARGVGARWTRVSAAAVIGAGPGSC